MREIVEGWFVSMDSVTVGSTPPGGKVSALVRVDHRTDGWIFGHDAHYGDRVAFSFVGDVGSYVQWALLPKLNS